MRPFKFRVWDKDLKVFVPTWEIVFWIDPETCNFEARRIVRFGEMELINAVIQQFTGLYDRDGQEIYEGDIVEVSYQMDEHGNSNIYKSEVVFERGSFGDKYDDFSNYLMLPNFSVRVVGNIFENAYLLK